MTKLAKAADAPLAPVPDELAGLDLDSLPDGLGEIDRSDIRFPQYLVNMKGTGANGRKIPEDEYFDTVNETVKPTVNAALLALHKTNLFSYFDETLQKTVKVCSSYDRVTGRMHESGLLRPCDGCPDAVWYKDPNGKRKRNCGPVYNVFGVDRDLKQPFVIKFKRTSLKVLQSYLQKHHINKRYQGGRYSNVHLYVFQCELSVKMSENGKYALPVLTRGPVLTSAEVHDHAANVKGILEIMIPVLAATEKHDADAPGDGDDSAGGDASFDTDRFVDQPGGAANANGFIE